MGICDGDRATRSPSRLELVGFSRRRQCLRRGYGPSELEMAPPHCKEQVSCRGNYHRRRTVCCEVCRQTKIRAAYVRDIWCLRAVHRGLLWNSLSLWQTRIGRRSPLSKTPQHSLAHHSRYALRDGAGLRTEMQNEGIRVSFSSVRNYRFIEYE